MSSFTYCLSWGHVTPDHQQEAVHLRKDIGNLGMWNIPAMMTGGKGGNIVQEMQRLNISLLGLCETRQTGSGDITCSGESGKVVWR